MLKKEFSKKDVNRARNLITGNTGASSETQVGYKKKTIKYKEGDVWTENKKTWTIKNGIKQTISKLDKVKKQVFVPLCCPDCSKVMNHPLDKHNYRVHKKCHDCVILFEHKLRIKGKYDDYIKDLKARNNLATLNDIESYLLNAINSTNSGYVTEQGEVERWVGGIDKKKLTEDITKATQEGRERLEKEINENKPKKIH
tara:strand:+ start:168 stop:764 length:597 start_codon:yes stop_codon:yes gene_type:complete